LRESSAHQHRVRISEYCAARTSQTKFSVQGLHAILISSEGDIMTKDSVRELYIDELRDLYNAETQLVKALPKMARMAANEQLRKAFDHHLRQTTEQVSRLEQIFEQLEEKPSGRKCLGMEGLVKEAAETMKEDYAEEVMDAAMIGAAQRVEHYEIAGYGMVRALAELLGETQQVSLLEQTLDEEKLADHKLNELSEEINPQGLEGDQHEHEQAAASSSHLPRNSRSRKVA
jgi:ferritin-like metal-binding protein YciE